MFPLRGFIGGIILLVLAGSVALTADARRHGWIHYVTGFVGIWFIFAPWVLSFVSRPGEVWASFILGIIAFVLSAWSLGSAPKTTAPPAPPRRTKGGDLATSLPPPSPPR